MSVSSPSRFRPAVDTLEAREVPAVFTVSGLVDTVNADNVLSLREAIGVHAGTIAVNQLSAAEQAQISGPPIGTNDTIQFATVGTIHLTSDLPTLTGKLTIQGPGANQVTLDGEPQYHPINVAVNGDVTVSGLRIARGHNTDSGGAVLNNGKLTVSRVEFENNTSGKHGGGDREQRHIDRERIVLP